MSAFVKPLDYYSRDYDIIGNYKQSMSQVIHLCTGATVEEARSFLDVKMDNEWKPKSPQMKALMREPRADRAKKKIDFLSYMDWVSAQNHILAPNLICYANPNIEESFLSGFISNNLATRSAVKKEGQAAGMAGDKEHEKFCDLLQANYKIRNNSISGALSSPFNPLYYASSHTSLTSVCRTITSYANACNEKLMASNRHYYSPEVTIENIAYVTSHADLTAVSMAMDAFNISPPSVDFVLNQIFESTRLYWNQESSEAMIETMVRNMTDVERAAFSFTGDLHALHQSNDTVVRLFYDKLSTRTAPVMDKAEQEKWLGVAEDNEIALASLLCSDFMKGKKPKDLDPEGYGVWIGHIKNVLTVLDEYQLFIDAFISTRLMVGAIHSLPTIVRKVVVGSDTDSSIFSTQKQVKWYTGAIDFSHAAVQAGAITSYLASQHIVHTLALLSGQMAVKKDLLFKLSMKSEFYSKGYSQTGVTKVYTMSIDAQEGNVFGKPKLEVKGVLLKSSKLPGPVRDEIEKFIWYCMGAPGVKGGISPLQPAAILAKIEHRIMHHLRSGNTTYFKTEQIKTTATYAAEDSAAQVVCKDIWNELFGAEKGYIEQLPADAYKVNVDLSKMDKLMAWGDMLGQDKKNKLREFLHQRGKSSMTQLLAPTELMEGGVIPKELLMVMDTRKVLFSLMQPFYILSNALSLNIANSKFTHFWSDDFTEEQADKHLPEGYTIEI